MRNIVADSWRRSLAAHGRREDAVVTSILEEDELCDYRTGHPLAPVLPVIDHLLMEPARDAGILVAVGDANSRLLWLGGDPSVRRRAESMAFLEGADWSESSVGTSAPGTALAEGSAVQIRGAEHFSPLVEAFSCTAMPITDPRTGTALGVVDITGGEQAVGGHALPWLKATVAAVEERLRGLEPARPAQIERHAGPVGAVLAVTGRDQGVLRSGGRELNLSVRHSEILVLLARHPRGLTAEELAERLYAQPVPPVTLRAELVRLRKVLDGAGIGVTLRSRPYRVEGLEVDSMTALALLERGSHRQALGAYGGQLLPRSEAPAIAELRDELSATLREAVVGSAAVDVVLHYLRLPEAADDAEAWRTALRLLPPRSPKRAAVVAHLERIAG
ncbi:transcriptional regulator [Sinomonas cellulolyticus]|uniref:Transcriptional regulator n=1 Tax=Sinomonas cellulolyticus TaxID=2801916 RepID=A0ABS1K7G8_9MICC|nr:MULTISPECIES: transcriptional regulator [Sinomonas]MBL0706256.1 transcriptional regulator [Sinomonas cellulolyticus]GHG55846.1 transcriptional regulator [Sinomonas sp. KCTC 49339]